MSIINESILAQLCQLAYQNPVDLKGSHFDHFDRLIGFQHGGAEALAAIKDDIAVVVVRGTQRSWIDLLYDVAFLWPKKDSAAGEVHRGFRHAADRLDAAGLWLLLDVPRLNHIYYCGHSLGGGVATNLAWDHLKRGLDSTPHVFTIGQPRTGTEAWAKRVFDAILSVGGTSWRFVHPLDVVPHLPPAGQKFLPRYRHVGPTTLIVDDHHIIPAASVQENLCGTLWQAFWSPLKAWTAHSATTYVDSLRRWVNFRTANGLSLFIDR